MVPNPEAISAAATASGHHLNSSGTSRLPFRSYQLLDSWFIVLFFIHLQRRPPASENLLTPSRRFLGPAQRLEDVSAFHIGPVAHNRQPAALPPRPSSQQQLGIEQRTLRDLCLLGQPVQQPHVRRLLPHPRHQDRVSHPLGQSAHLARRNGLCQCPSGAGGDAGVWRVRGGEPSVSERRRRIHVQFW